METKRKNREWSENSKVIEGIFRKPAKVLQKEKKQVAQLLDEKFPPNEPTGETPDKLVSQISHLKYIPPLKRVFIGLLPGLNVQHEGEKKNCTWSTS
jgi:hypothetical protein